MDLPDIIKAVRMYYEKPELSSADIKELFNCCATTATKLKEQARTEMVRQKVGAWSKKNVNTRAAFKAWNIDIKDYEERLQSLNKLKKIEESLNANKKELTEEKRV